MAKKAKADYPARPLPPVTEVKDAKPSPASVVKEARKKQMGRNGYASN